MTQSLFDTPEGWRMSPLLAFQSFIASAEYQLLSLKKNKKTEEGSPVKPLRQSSQKILGYMFAKFVRWYEAKGLDVYSISSDHILTFLGEYSRHGDNSHIDTTSEIRHKYLRMFERIFIHLAISPNPASEALLVGRAQYGKDAAKVALTISQQIDFMNALPDVEYSGVPGSDGWHIRRDRAIQAMLLGAGLKVSELIGLYVENVGEIDINGSVSITVSPAAVSGLTRWHQTQLRNFAVPIVMEWVEERKQMQLGHKFLFPSSRKNTVKLSKVQIYRMVKETLDRANIREYHSGGGILRNSYAARELSESTPNVELIKEYLGLYKLRSAAKYLPKKPITS